MFVNWDFKFVELRYIAGTMVYLLFASILMVVVPAIVFMYPIHYSLKVRNFPLSAIVLLGVYSSDFIYYTLMTSVNYAGRDSIAYLLVSLICFIICFYKDTFIIKSRGFD